MSKSQHETQELMRLLELSIKRDNKPVIYTILRHVSRSGMSRVIQLVTFDKQNQPLYLGWSAAKAMGWKYDDNHSGIKVNGAGMDMGFHTVYTLSQTLYGPQNGYNLTQEWL